MPLILIVEDDQDTRTALKAALQFKGHEVHEASNGKAALESVENMTFDAVILDLVLGDMDGLVVLEKIRREDTDLPVLILTGHGDVQTAVMAMKLGAVDYLLKPFGNDELNLVIEKALEGKRLSREVQALKRHVLNFQPDTVVLGKSPAIRKVIDLINQVADTDLTVILEGPSGSGKEVWAQKTHQQSHRRNNQFVALDCGTLQETLVASELFGYEKGAFTGADKKKLGLFEVAFRGTIFLDEVSNLSLSIQAKLLRVLQEKRLRHLGGKKDIPVDVRVIVASNKNLAMAVKEGGFREDLYHRLNQFTIQLPGLSDRKEDIPALAADFLSQANRTLKKNVRSISGEAMSILKNYSWPGNVRELKNSIIRAALLADAQILPEHLQLSDLTPAAPQTTAGLRLPDNSGWPAAPQTTAGLRLPDNSGWPAAPPSATQQQTPENMDLKSAVKSVAADTERCLIARALEMTGNNKVKAAKLLKIDRKALYNKLHQYKLR